ncbi:MAG: hypothetical protein K0Q79_1960 [Flavipsychrobacter sp.]|nr:hypothetical protein [Flavipsychrobacter sp.]
MKKLWLLLFVLLPLFVQAQIIMTFAGGGSIVGGSGIPATAVKLSNPAGGVFDKQGNYYFVEALGGNRVRKIDPSGMIATIAGTGVAGFSGDNGPATAATLQIPTCVVLDSSDNIYISDGNNFRIRKIDAATGVIRTIVGNGVGGYSGNGVPATAASISNAPGICLDRHGNLFIADFGNARVRKVTPAGIITTIAGNGGISGYSGDGSRADTATINGISDVFVDAMDNIYLAGNSNSRIFKINSAGIISTIAGTSAGYIYNGDNISATTANIDPQRLTLDKFGNLFFGEYHNYRVRIVIKGVIHTVAGNGTPGFSGDGGAATNAQLLYPVGIALDSCGNLYVPEANNNRVRKVTYSKCNYLDILDPIKEKQESSLSPNPATTQLTISAPGNIKEAFVYNLPGQIAARCAWSGAREASINISQLPPGTYLLRIIMDDGNAVVKRFVKE